MKVMSKITFAPKYKHNTEQLLENGEKPTINTHYWLSSLQNESEINYVGKGFKANNLLLIGKHI